MKISRNAPAASGVGYLNIPPIRAKVSPVPKRRKRRRLRLKGGKHGARAIRKLFVFGLLLLLFTLLSPALTGQFPLEFSELPVTFDKPLGLIAAGDGSDEIYVLCKDGLVERYDLETEERSAWLDLSEILEVTGEAGILGGAFHPAPDSNYFYVSFTVPGPSRKVPVQIKVGRFTFNDRGDMMPESELELLSINKPHVSQSGGGLAFGPDGYLYIGTGDGGGRDDQFENGQNPLSLLGKILRINVDRPGRRKPYSIPVNNPFVGTADTLSEIWSLGLRNPFRFSFDAETGDFYISDKGNSFWQEVNFQEAGNPGGQNYGWNCQEGFEEFTGASERFCGDDPESYTSPLIAYGKDGHHTVNGGSITGGFVYRGADEELNGKYIFGDFYSHHVFIYDTENQGADNRIDSVEVSTDKPISNLTTFGLDNKGGLYAVDYNGHVFHIESMEPSAVSRVPVPLVLKVYPNPARDNLTVEWPGGLPPGAIITLYATDGRVVHRQSGSDGLTSARVSIPELPRGMYSLHVRAGKRSGRARVSII